MRSPTPPENHQRARKWPRPRGRRLKQAALLMALEGSSNTPRSPRATGPPPRANPPPAPPDGSGLGLQLTPPPPSTPTPTLTTINTTPLNFTPPTPKTIHTPTTPTCSTKPQTHHHHHHPTLINHPTHPTPPTTPTSLPPTPTSLPHPRPIRSKRPLGGAQSRQGLTVEGARDAGRGARGS